MTQTIKKPSKEKQVKQLTAYGFRHSEENDMYEFLTITYENDKIVNIVPNPLGQSMAVALMEAKKLVFKWMKELMDDQRKQKEA